MYFLALTFSPHYLLFKRLETFRKRFDPSYSKTKLLHMSLLPPFWVSSRMNISHLMDHLEEVIDDYLSGHLNEPLSFKALDFTFGRKGTLCLSPDLSADLEYCIEGLMDELKHCEVRFKRRRSFYTKPFLPLGRYLQKDELHLAYKQAYEEFPLPLELQPHKIVLFEKGPNYWSLKADLFTFEGIGHNMSIATEASFT